MERELPVGLLGREGSHPARSWGETSEGLGPTAPEEVPTWTRTEGGEPAFQAVLQMGV